MDLSLYITKDGEHFYFDTDCSIEADALPALQIDYEDGDIIKWTWEGQKMIGTLRYAGYKLFKLHDVKHS